MGTSKQETVHHPARAVNRCIKTMLSMAQEDFPNDGGLFMLLKATFKATRAVNRELFYDMFKDEIMLEFENDILAKTPFFMSNEVLVKLPWTQAIIPGVRAIYSNIDADRQNEYWEQLIKMHAICKN